MLLACVMLLTGNAMAQTANVAWAYNYPVEDTVLVGLSSIRGMGYDDDLLGDGVSAIVVSNYVDDGRVHVFKAAGNNAMELVWTSPAPDSLGGGSTPRFAVFGDLDGDNRKEVIYHSRYNGIFVYEWDGVAGSYNFGTKPSQVITRPVLSIGTSGTEYIEYLEVNDYDLDGKQELIVAYNSAPNANDNYYVISAIGNWSTDSPGFSGFATEFVLNREEPGEYGLGGSPFAMIGADLDGDEDTDIIATNWNFKNVVPITTVEADSFAKPDTSSGKAHFYLTEPDDDVALFAGTSTDIDGDGRDEVYLPTYGTNFTKLHMIHYESGQSTREIDSSNVVTIDLAPYISSHGLGIGYGDIDQDDKPNIYISSISGYPENVITAEFQGGDKTDPNNWMVETLYEGDSTIISSILVEIDTNEVADTLSKNINAAFVSKMWAKYTDFDKDGFEDIFLPYQGMNDSVTVGIKRWLDGSNFEVTEEKSLNPKRFSLRILENGVTGIRSSDVQLIMPDDYELRQNYPNPFNPETNIEFFLPIKKKISLIIYNAIGQKVKTLVDAQTFEQGSHLATWDGTNEAGVRVASGVYIYTLRYGNFALSKRMTLLK